MDTETQVQQAAFTLAQARRSASATSPLVEEWPELDADTAFRIQQHDVAARVAAGDRVVGFKLGNIAKAMQNAFGLDQPDYGTCWPAPSSTRGSPSTGRTTSTRSWNSNPPSCSAPACRART